MQQIYQIYINGVPMLPCRYPLTAISPSGMIPISKGDADLMNMFAYSKSEPSKTKIDQAVFDEILQNMVMKQRQSAMVPRANNSDKIVTPDMFLGGRIISNIDPKKLQPLIEDPGITNSDFSFYELFKTHIDSKTISSLLEGQQTSGDMTLGQYMDQQKKAMLKIGSKIDGIINWEKQMLRLRVMNILAHGYEYDEDDKSYKDISLEDTTHDGNTGLNLIKFDEANYRTPEDVHEEELNYESENGTEVAITYINPKLMRQALTDPDYYFFYEVVPVDKNNDKLTQMLFISKITQAANLFGMESLQVGRLKRRYAQVMGESYDDIFKDDKTLQIDQQQQSMLEQAQQTQPKISNNNMQPKVMDAMYQ